MRIIFLIFITLFNLSFAVTADGLSTSEVEALTVQEKKSRFFNLVVPAITAVHKEQNKEYSRLLHIIAHNKDKEMIESLKEKYNASTKKELMYALKPHPISITIAQAAIESAWGTSRFFNIANNIFGVWSLNKSEPRVAASESRGSHTVWLKKFESFEDSVRDYYRVLGAVRAYSAFRETRFYSDDVAKIASKLDRYSELGDEYTKKLLTIIEQNKLTQYD